MEAEVVVLAVLAELYRTLTDAQFQQEKVLRQDLGYSFRGTT